MSEKTGDKTDTISIRITPELNDYLDHMKEVYGISKSEFCRKIIKSSLEGEKFTIESKESFLLRKQLVYEVNAIGKNVNQIVHNFNSEFYNEFEKKKLFALLNKLMELFQNGQSSDSETNNK